MRYALALCALSGLAGSSSGSDLDARAALALAVASQQPVQPAIHPQAVWVRVESAPIVQTAYPAPLPLYNPVYQQGWHPVPVAQPAYLQPFTSPCVGGVCPPVRRR